MSKFVYELVDVTDPETYYTIGIFEDLGALGIELSCVRSPIGEHGDCDCHCYEIRRREIDKIAWSETGEVIARANLVNTYNEERDKNFWKLEACHV